MMNARLLPRRNTKQQQGEIQERPVVKEWLSGLGSQNEMFERADRLGDTFYVSREQKLYEGKNTYSYNSFKNLDKFLEYQSSIDGPKHFYEIIRECRPCREYYDIDALKTDFTSIQSFLTEFDSLREEFLKTQQTITDIEPLLEKYQRNIWGNITIDRRIVPTQIVIEACNDKKFSLHILYNQKRKFRNTTELKYFMNEFNNFLKSKDTKIELDLSVYNRNSAMRCIGSSKVSDISRVFKSYHSIDLPMSNFFISNPSSEVCHKLNMIEQPKKDKSEYPKLTDEEELEFCKTLIKHINKDRACNYEDWFRFGCALFNVLNGSKEGLEIFLEFSQFCPDKYNEQTCIDLYQSFRDPELNDNIGKGSLIYWYNQDKTGYFKPRRLIRSK